MSEAIRPEGPDLSRRDFVKTLGAAALASSVGPSLATNPNSSSSAETAVGRFYKSLKGDQKALICFPFDHPLCSRVSNNWAIVEPRISDLNSDQQALCREIFKNLCSDDGHGRFLRQMDEDYGGFSNYHVAVFGEPGTDRPFEWVLTGRHATLRTDGISSSGPIFYGHASQCPGEDARRTGNVWWYQAERADAIFKTLDDEQKARALDFKTEPDGARPRAAGLPVVDLDGAQKELVRDLLRDLLSPFRSFADEGVAPSIRDHGALRLAYFREGGQGFANVGDVWKLEGPAFSWYFHGTPHVHVWVNVGTNMSGT